MQVELAVETSTGGWVTRQDPSISGEVSDDAVPPERCCSAAGVPVPHEVKRWLYGDVREMHRRRYQLQPLGLEFFSTWGDQVSGSCSKRAGASLCTHKTSTKGRSIFSRLPSPA